MTVKAAKVMLEDAILTISDFWEASEEDQESALETAVNIMEAMLKLLEENENGKETG